MEVDKSGRFIFEIGADELARGLRPSKRSPRNTKFLVTCQGAVGRDKVLQIIDDLNEALIDTSVEITDGFPFPQIFVFTNVIIVCGETDIYELVGTLQHKLAVAPGIEWSAVDFGDFIYMSNGEVAVTRSADDGTYALNTTTLPYVSGMVNFNGQVLVSAPNVEFV